jgi:hypothetical protein
MWLVRAALAAGDHDRARTLAGNIPAHHYSGTVYEYLNGHRPADPYGDVDRRGPLIDVLIAAGDRETALSIVHSTRQDPILPSLFDTGGRHEPELGKLVRAELAAGDHERALAIANEIAVSPAAATASMTPVGATTRLMGSARAQSLLAEVLVLGQWHESIRLVATVAPEALLRVLDELDARYGPSGHSHGRL